MSYEEFSAAYERTAAGRITGAPSRSTYRRWLNSQFKGAMPYEGAGPVVEAMFPSWTAIELFGPYEPDHHAPGAPTRVLADLAAQCGWKPPGLHESGPGQVVPLGTHPRYAAQFKPLACGQVAAARAALGLTLPEFAALLETALGWTVLPEAVGLWETESVPPGDVVLFCQSFVAGTPGSPAGYAGGRDELTARRAARRRQ
jgi:hypothetical protein